MGGQACVLYGGAEFSRDTDLVLIGDDENLNRFRIALAELQAETIAVPPFEKSHLEEGLAIHFRCRHPDAPGMRVDVMTKLRGVDDFESLWDRRTTFDLDGELLEVLSLPDLVAAKKTQRDKDWSMIRRLLEADFYAHHDNATLTQRHFWFHELRTSALLIELMRADPEIGRELLTDRPLLQAAIDENESLLNVLLRDEEEVERQADRDYWAPLKARLEELRVRRKQGEQ